MRSRRVNHETDAIARVAHGSLGGRAMKLARTPLLLLVSLLVILVSPGPAYASSVEDAFADGDIDAEDLATQSPWRSAAAGAGGPLLGGRAPAAYLSVVGFTREVLDDRREIGGFLVLGLPLDAFARGRARPITPSSSALAIPERAAPSAPSDLGLTPASSTSQPFEIALTPRFARSCVSAAWRAAGLGADDARLDAIVSRARWSALLPEARLRAIRTDDARLSLDTTTTTDTSRLRDSAGANVGLEARLTWRFDRLLYADDEPAFERIRRELRDTRARVAARVLEALFHWQRAALDLRSLPPSQRGTRDEADVVLRVKEAEAALDVLTNGWFTARRPSAVEAPRSADPSRPIPLDHAAPVPVGGNES